MTISSIKRKSGRSRKSRRRTPVRCSQNRNRTPVRRSNRNRTPARRSQNRNRTPVRRSNRRLGGGGAGAYIGAAATGVVGFAASKALTDQNFQKIKTIHFMLHRFNLSGSEKQKLNTVIDELQNTLKFTGLYMSNENMKKLMGRDLHHRYEITRKIQSLNEEAQQSSPHYNEYLTFLKDYELSDEEEEGGGEGKERE